MQLAFMRALWAIKKGSVAQVQAQLENEGHTFAPTTVSTVLRRLEARRLVTHDEEGRTFVYRALKSQKQLSKSLVASLAATLFDGRVGPLLCQLVSANDVDADELAAIKAAIAQKEAEVAQRQRGRK
jgi:predicted transcriptional regulator